MQNKVYYHNLKENTNIIELAHFYYRNIIKINAGSESVLVIGPEGYQCYGNNIPSDIEIYYKAADNLFYIVKQPSNNSYYLTLINEYPIFHGSDLISGKAQIFDTTGLTKLSKLNIMQYPIQKIDTNITGGESLTFESLNNKNQYQSFMSLVLINARNNAGVSLSAVYMMSKVNAANNNTEYTLTQIAVVGTPSNFGLSATNTGFTLTNASNTRYKILEIACGSDVI